MGALKNLLIDDEDFENLLADNKQLEKDVQELQHENAVLKMLVAEVKE